MLFLRQGLPELDRDRFRITTNLRVIGLRYQPGLWQTASMLCPSGSNTNAP